MTADTIHAEAAYLFRHALLRDAAYTLQLPAERGALHRLALELIPAAVAPDALPALAMELADHARLGITDDQTQAEHDLLLAREHEYLTVAAAHFYRAGQSVDEVAALDRLAQHKLTAPADAAVHLIAASDRELSRAAVQGSESRARRAVEIAREIGNEALETRGLLALHHSLQAAGREQPAGLDLAGLVANADADPELRYSAMMALSGQHARTGRQSEAYKIEDQGEALAREAGHKKWEIRFAMSRVLRLAATGAMDQAQQVLHEAIEWAKSIDDRQLLASLLNYLGLACVSGGQYHEADKAYAAALDVAKRAGMLSEAGAYSVNRSNLYLYFLGDTERAKSAYVSSMEFHRECGLVDGRASAARRLSSLYLAGCQWPEALAIAREGLEGARRTGEVGLKALLLCNIGRNVEVAWQERLDAIRQAAALTRQIDGQALRREIWYWCGEVLLLLGLLQAGAEALENASKLNSGLSDAEAWIPVIRPAQVTAAAMQGDAAAAAELASGLLTEDALPGLRFLSVGLAIITSKLLAVAGPIGVGPAPPETLEVVRPVGARMRKDIAATGYQDLPTTIAALAAADAAVNALEAGPPYPLLMGRAPESLEAPTISAALACLGSKAETLESENPALAEVLNDRASPLPVAWNTPLNELLGANDA